MLVLQCHFSLNANVETTLNIFSPNRLFREGLHVSWTGILDDCLAIVPSRVQKRKGEVLPNDFNVTGCQAGSLVKKIGK